MRTVAAALAILLIAGCSARGDQPAAVNQTTLDNSVSNEMAEADPTLPTRLSLTGPQFASQAAASDAFEIAEAKLARTQASLPSSRDYAAAMLQAHAGSSARLRQTTASLSPPLTPDPTLSSPQQAKVDALSKLSGQAFDDQYVRDQVSAHEAALATLHDYALHGDMPALKDYANQLAPEVQAHLSMARNLPR